MSQEKQRIIQEFLRCPANKALYDEYKKTNSEELKFLIDFKFKKFYQNYRIISYLIKVLHYESRHFDRKIRSHKFRNQLTITTDIDISSGYYEKDFSDSICFSEDIVEHIASDNLYYCLRKLSDRQKKILSLVYVRQMTDKEVAQHLGISQQAVSKTRRNIIKNIRKELTYV